MVCRDNLEFSMPDRLTGSEGMGNDEAVATQRTVKIGSPPKVRIADLQVPSDYRGISRNL
jgi:hypothetical protein